ncbi:hypothetical protein [Actinacidiphila rubida]|uniref:Lipoprotein n=1 Tax=Actinacidiphila rubida TaxID=310780 RepID=A0A1H8MQ88_9ACTN|nr:hypothetical protein [Actinacidiphila rubida]SEO19469.1 hypothetical protein SAMN05216267_1019132 [Actinacidiphila rubida]
MRGGGVAAAVVAVAVGVLLAGCGTQVGTGTTVPTETATGPIPWVVGEPSFVTGARLGADHRTVTLDVQVADGPRPCVRDLKAVDTDAAYGAVPGTVHVQVTYSSPSGDRRSGCTKERGAQTRVTLPAPLGDNQLVVDDHTVFTADGAKPPALRLCGQLGCDPAPTGCTPGSYDQALLAVGAPEHTLRGDTDCRGTWMVMAYTWRTGPACSGETSLPACSSALGDRYFFRAETSGWVPIAEGAAGGCAVVQRKAPDFPTSMCKDLAPLSGKLHPHYPPPSASP